MRDTVSICEQRLWRRASRRGRIPHVDDVAKAAREWAMSMEKETDSAFLRMHPLPLALTRWAGYRANYIIIRLRYSYY
jgi:hypothetical protein